MNASEGHWRCQTEGGMATAIASSKLLPAAVNAHGDGARIVGVDQFRMKKLTVT